MNIKELIEQRLLRKIPPDPDKVKKSIEIAETFLNDANDLNKQKKHRLTILAAYTAMFHAARAILYRDGIQEKSHYAIYVYLKEKYEHELEDSLFELNAAREQRHQGTYGLDYEFDKSDAEHIVSEAKKFILKAKRILKGE